MPRPSELPPGGTGSKDGRVFAGYRDVELIGVGGLGRLYRAVRESTGGLVAIKEIQNVDEGSSSWTRARRELDALLRLKGHPHVISVEEIIDRPDGPCLVMEYAPGGSLQDRVQNGPLPDPDLVLVGQHVASALGAAHELGIIHRDVKPANLVISGFGEVKVCDFGIAALFGPRNRGTQTKAFTVAYASPEEVDDEAVVGPPADVYSFAATMVHLLTGRRPTFKDRAAGTGIEIELASGSDPVVMAPVLATLRAGLAHDPDARPTMRDLAATFDVAAIALGPARLRRLTMIASVPLQDSSLLSDATIRRPSFTEPPSAAPAVPEPQPIEPPLAMPVGALAPPPAGSVTHELSAPLAQPDPHDETLPRTELRSQAVVPATEAPAARRGRRAWWVAAAAAAVVTGCGSVVGLALLGGDDPESASAATSTVVVTTAGATTIATTAPPITTAPTTTSPATTSTTEATTTAPSSTVPATTAPVAAVTTTRPPTPSTRAPAITTSTLAAPAPTTTMAKTTTTPAPTLPPPTTTTVKPKSYPKGDVNRDCIVNQADVDIVQSDLGTTNSRSDLNGDRIVNATDLSIVDSQRGATC